MKVTLILVGRTTDKRYAELTEEYIKRLKHYISFETIIIPQLKNAKNLTPEQQKYNEAELIVRTLQPGDHITLLDEHGKEMRSIEMAHWMRHKMNIINKRLVFIIGGPYGFSPKIYELADEKISMSKMTFSHQMIRLIFVEQLYRSMTILNGEPYHHE